MIALAALHMAACHIDRDLTSWFAELSVDLNKILTISKDILKLYEIWNDYKEDESLAEIFNKVNSDLYCRKMTAHFQIPKPKQVDASQHGTQAGSNSNNIT